MSKKNVIKKSALAPTILISGGAGFIGSYLTEAFLEKGARVIVTDDVDSLDANKVARFVNNPKFGLFNVGTSSAVPEQIESVDYVIYVGDLEKYFVDKDNLDLDTLLMNSELIRNLLDLTYKSEGKFLLLSTIDVENDSTKTNIDPNYFGHTSLPTDIYSIPDAKRFAEALVWEHARKYGTNVRIVRLPYLYGPKMSLSACGALGVMLRDLVHRQNLEIYGNEDRKEYYLYIDDAISGIIKSLFNPNTSGNVYSLVGEDSHKVLTTAFLLRNLADRRTEIEFKKSVKQFNEEVKVSDVYNLKNLNWWPQVSLKEGIIQTLDHFGYKINRNSFKPLELIENKKLEKALKSGSVEELFSKEDVEDIQMPQGEFEFDDDEPSEKRFKFNVNLPKILKKLKIDTFFTVSPAIVLSSLAVFLSGFIIFVITPVLGFNSGIRDTYSSLEQVQNSLYKFDIANAQIQSSQATIHLNKAQSAFIKSKWLYTLILGKDGYNSMHNILTSLSYFSNATHDLTLALSPFEDLWSIVHPESKNVLEPKLLEQSSTYILSANNDISMAKANFEYVNKDSLPKKSLGLLEQYESYLNILNNDLNLLSTINSDLYSLLGVTEPKTYLIWFQNPNEIRPTGGFIGSYGLLTVDKGKITNLVIDDIYNPDGQIDIRGIKVAPPAVVANYLAEDHLYLRNSNWDPDFTKSASAFSDLYFKVTGKKVDGIIAVDLFFVKDILSTLGPVYLASYNEEINADNLYERTQYHSGFAYQEGVSEKKEFLTVLGGKLLEKLFSLEENQLPKLVGNIHNSLEQKHLLVSFNNNSTNLLLDQKNWNGKLISTQGDYLYIVNSNLGGTKSNYYVENSYDYSINSKTRDGLLRAVLKLNYNHTGKDESWPGGPYKDYLRVLTQKGIKLTGATIEYPNGEIKDIFSDVKVLALDTVDSIEYGFTLNPQESMRIIIEYDLPEQLSLTKSFKDYNLVWQKQPGTIGDTINFALNAPFGMNVTNVQTDMKLVESSDTINISDMLNTDKKLFIKME